MATARRDHDWSIASAQMATLANVNRPKGRAPFSPRDFNPYAKKRSQGGIEKAIFDLVGKHA